MSIYVQSNQIISELRCHRNLLTSSKTAPLCLKQFLVVRTSLIQISHTRTSILTILRFLCVIFFIICHDFNPSVWHTQRMTNFVTIFLWRFFAPVWHSLKAGLTLGDFFLRHRLFQGRAIFNGRTIMAPVFISGDWILGNHRPYLII